MCDPRNFLCVDMFQLIQWMIWDVDELLVGLIEPGVYSELRYFVDTMIDLVRVSLHSLRDFSSVEML